jgi:hypothetical protein
MYTGYTKDNTAYQTCTHQASACLGHHRILQIPIIRYQELSVLALLGPDLWVGIMIKGYGIGWTERRFWEGPEKDIEGKPV